MTWVEITLSMVYCLAPSNHCPSMGAAAREERGDLTKAGGQSRLMALNWDPQTQLSGLLSVMVGSVSTNFECVPGVDRLRRTGGVWRIRARDLDGGGSLSSAYRCWGGQLAAFGGKMLIRQGRNLEFSCHRSMTLRHHTKTFRLSPPPTSSFGNRMAKRKLSAKFSIRTGVQCAVTITLTKEG